jgi:mercuric ion transport protein
MTVELIYDCDCPNVLAARGNLIKAIAASSREVRWTEWDSSATDSSPHVKGYGSPTVLVDGKDVAENSASGAGASCRLYRRGDVRFDGAPSVEQIVAASASQRGASVAAQDGWKSSLSAVPGIAFAFLPKIVCPACWGLSCWPESSLSTLRLQRTADLPY